MVLLLFCLLTFQCPAHAKSSRTVHLADGEMEPVYVESGYSTLLKFSSHPEPGLIGDQDGFKVEYLKNIVAIKPLVAKGKTNLFVFTKDGQFNFQLVAGRGQHDNVVYVEPKADKEAIQASGARVAVPVDDLFTTKINASTATKAARLTLESVSMPIAKTTMVLRINVQSQSGSKAPVVEAESLQVFQGKRPIRVENTFLEQKRPVGSVVEASVLILLRTSEFKTSEDVRLVFTLKPNPSTSSSAEALQINVHFNRLGFKRPR